MRIAILTLPLYSNYGGNLQAYALMEYLKKMGHQPVFVNLIQPHTCSKIKIQIKSIIKGLPWLGEKIISSKDIYVHSNHFINTYIRPQTIKIEGREALAKIHEGFDCFIVGSDQVWRKDYAGVYMKDFFLDFLADKKIRRISYAASFGIDSWQFDETMTKALKNLIQKFDLVTVREDSAVYLCKQHFDIDASHVVDPTILLKKEDYMQLVAGEDPPQSPGDCMVYVLDDSIEKKNLIKKICEDGNFTWYTVNAQNKNKKDSIERRRFPPVTNWLKGFIDSKFVITDSFHGMAFSIIFNKPFIVIGNKQRGFARFTSLAKMFNVKHQVLSSVDDYDSTLLSNEINWNDINLKLDGYRKQTNSLLNTYLK